MRCGGSLAARHCHAIHKPDDQNANSDVIHNCHGTAVPIDSHADPHRTVMRSNPYRCGSFRAFFVTFPSHLTATVRRSPRTGSPQIKEALVVEPVQNRIEWTVCPVSSFMTKAAFPGQ